jgi:hypothetical protein
MGRRPVRALKTVERFAVAHQAVVDERMELGVGGRAGEALEGVCAVTTAAEHQLARHARGEDRRAA